MTAGSSGSVTFVSDMAPVKSGVATGGPPTSGEAKRRRYRAKHRAVQADRPASSSYHVIHHIHVTDMLDDGAIAHKLKEG